jgi:hypothetical protein
MRTVFIIIAALATVTFPVYFVVFTYKSLILGIMALVVVALWLLGQLAMRVRNYASNMKNRTVPLLRR